MLKPRFNAPRGDIWLIVLPLILSLFGLVMIFDASYVAAIRDFNDKFHYLKLQSVWLLLGIGLFFVFAKINHQILKKIALPLFLATFVLLTLVLIPGIGKEVLGGRRWLQVGSMVFQPAELTKLSLVIYLSSLFEKKRKFWPFLLTMITVLTLLILEPDLGTAIIIAATGTTLYFIAGAPLSHLGFVLFLALASGPFLVLFSPYRKKRWLTFLDSSFDIQGASYHIRQVLIALGAGGIFGRGLGQSRQKFLFLPEVTTDSIFAVIGEELGFLGATILISLFVFLIYRGLRTALFSVDNFGQMLSAGIIFFIGFQTVINISAMVWLLPLTGVPLPFVSYGGSSLIVFLTGMGIVYNISRFRKRLKK